MSLSRREVLALGFAAAGAAICVRGFSPFAYAAGPRSLTTLGPLKSPDANGLRLPEGFSSRIVARTGERPAASSPYEWHPAPDGGCVFAAKDGGWIYVSNSEVTRRGGGVGALRFARDGTLVSAYPILRGTTFNCAGGGTPWGTWLSCEEFYEGQVWECDPEGVRAPEPRPALGLFTHEAVAVDPRLGQLYLTEDLPDGRFYRFSSAAIRGGVSDLGRGTLEAAEMLEDGTVRWHRIDDPSGRTRPTREQAPQSTAFRGGEGCWHANGMVYFTTKGDGRVWAFDIARQHLRVFYDTQRPEQILTGVDNVTVSAALDVLVAEDAGNMEIVAISQEGRAAAIVQVVDHPASEVTGIAFNPAGNRLYFSSQRGASGKSTDGVTYEVIGPFV